MPSTSRHDESVAPEDGRSKSWWARPFVVAIVSLIAGATLPLGCSTGQVMIDADPYVALVFIALGLLAAAAGPLIVRKAVHKRTSIFSWIAGMVVATLVVSLVWRPAADWYNMVRCRDGVVGACWGSFTQGSARVERDDFYAPRRACELGRVHACGVVFKVAPHHRDETCNRVRQLCENETHAVFKKTACHLAEEHCHG